MSWHLVARKEVASATRSRVLWSLLGLFVVVLPGVAIGYVLISRRPVVGTLLVYFVTLSKWLVPITALVVGYGAIVGEREAGTLKFLLGLPHTRFDVVLGKALARTGAVWAAVLLGFAVSVPVIVLLYDGMMPGRYLLLVGLTLLLGTAFVSLAVAVSTVTRSPVRVVSGAIGAFVLFMFLWDLVPASVYFVTFGELPGNVLPPSWFFLLRRINPVNAYTATLVDLYPNLASPVPRPRPFYLTAPFTVGLLLAWSVIPLVAGTFRFASVDLE